jgi:hypothetical protein
MEGDTRGYSMHNFLLLGFGFGFGLALLGFGFAWLGLV